MIVVECKPDEVLVRNVASVSRRQIIHEPGKGAVCRRLDRISNTRAVVDEDPGSAQPSYLDSAVLSENLEAAGLKVLSDVPRNNLVVVLRPRLEDWLLYAVRESGVDATDYRLPNDPKELKKVINLNLDRLEKLVMDLLDARSDRMLALQRLLKQRRTRRRTR